MSLKKLKQQNPDLTIDIVDILSQYDLTKTKKLTPFLVKMFKKEFMGGVMEKEDPKPLRSLVRDESEGFIRETIDKEGRLLHRMIKEVIVDRIGYNNMCSLYKLVNHLENKRIPNSDVTSYSDWEDINNQVNVAELTSLNKKLTKQIEVVYEDDEWLVLKPLSFLSSITYGSNTKWCTSMKNEKEYFYRYSKNGILVYVLNKIGGQKYAFYSSRDISEGISVWDQRDIRVDSIETTIPNEILMKIKLSLNIKENGTNHSKFSEEELSNMEDYHSPKKLYVEESRATLQRVDEQEFEVDDF